jgi:hypothetical protein
MLKRLTPNRHPRPFYKTHDGLFIVERIGDFTRGDNYRVEDLRDGRHAERTFYSIEKARAWISERRQC